MKAMMLRMSFQQGGLAAQVEQALRKMLADGLRTGDIHQPGCTLVGTEEMAQAVC
jgi:3-isopropylmalate dehydrogenase